MLRGDAMVVFQKRMGIILVQVFLGLIDFVNLLLSNILIYEVSEGVSFDFDAMIHNWLFWVLLILHFSHIMVMRIINYNSSANDQIVEDAIAKEQVTLLGQYTAESEKGNYENAKKVLKLYDQLAKRRKK